MQTIMNNMENDGVENKSVANLYHSKLKSGMNVNASTSNASLGEAVKTTLSQSRKRAVKNIVLVPYKPKPTEFGSWKIKSPYATSTIASPSLVPNEQNKNDEVVYVPHSPYYSPVHLPKFYGDE